MKRVFTATCLAMLCAAGLAAQTPAYDQKQKASDAAKMEEKAVTLKPGDMKLTDTKDKLHYAFKVEDPTTWDTPWSGEYEFTAGQPLYEYACHEGNYALTGILAGGRQAEKRTEGGQPGN